MDPLIVSSQSHTFFYFYLFLPLSYFHISTFSLVFKSYHPVFNLKHSFSETFHRFLLDFICLSFTYFSLNICHFFVHFGMCLSHVHTVPYFMQVFMSSCIALEVIWLSESSFGSLLVCNWTHSCLNLWL